MAFGSSCRACGKVFAAQGAHTGCRSRCIACGAHVQAPSRTASEAGGVAPPTEEKKRPLWKDPVVVIGAAVPALVLTWFFFYLWVDHAEREFEGRAVQLKIEADGLARSGQSRAAYDKYEELLTMIRDKWFGSGRYHLIVTSAESVRKNSSDCPRRTATS
jgi:hypothetical protein